jgi:hypothetical protein
MKSFALLSRTAIAAGTVSALLAGCSGSQAPIAAPGTVPASRASATQADDGSWMLPEAKSQDLLYVSDLKNVLVFSYPGGRLVGKLTGFRYTHGMCVDRDGDVYITDATLSKIFEYAHGSKTRLKALGGSLGPVGCSVDPTTGNLAVTEIAVAAVAVYSNARGTPTVYQNASLSEAYWLGYDGDGNLFVDGRQFTNPPSFVFLELAKGSSTLTTVALDQRMGFPGGVQWDGKHVAVGTYTRSGEPVIYRFAISGDTGSKTGTTPLRNGPSDVMQFWIDGKTVVAPNVMLRDGKYSDGAAYFYDYPAGGKAYKTITKDIRGATGAAISLASH